MKKLFGIRVLALSLLAIFFVSFYNPLKKDKTPAKKIFISSFMTMHDPFFLSLTEGNKKMSVYPLNW